MTDATEFSHFDASGNARMVDVSTKNDSTREATAAGSISMSKECFELVKAGSISKGDVLGVARIAGIMAAKKVDALIPLTHPLPITKADINFTLDEARCKIDILATVGITGKTGVEMEALTAVSVAALTIYDMSKAVDKGMTINNIRLIRKSGGKSGEYIRDNR
ncbi:MAG: cyclic pyranopterin monophosphate synthase MoaC [Desulfobulbaceae bacterium]|uniref:Cyclic pyranopterin monophosphate synthase n=1 Tax=Candidatus Desulfobia pelagia TaxID=2841692 RepID=A0A8J6TGS7_9BACT|nr:cyclic pyranopterin monophosphate synthase MoaC [Candidatus Desulfobia pelagia]